MDNTIYLGDVPAAPGGWTLEDEELEELALALPSLTEAELEALCQPLEITEQK